MQDRSQDGRCSYEKGLQRLLRRIGNQWCKHVVLCRAGLQERGFAADLLEISELETTLPGLSHVAPVAALIQRESFEATMARLRSNTDTPAGSLQNCVDFVLVRCPILDKKQLEELMMWPVDTRWGIPGAMVEGSQILQSVAVHSLTLILTRVDFRFSRLASFAECVSGVVRRLANATLYWTPATPNRFNSGFQPHEDDHCVVILQLQGAKHWILWPSWGMRCRRFLKKVCTKAKKTLTHPQRPKTTPLKAKMRPFGRPWKQITLKAGDLLYLPQGVPHAAWSSHDSLHLTVGLEDEFLFSWEGFVHVMIAQSTSKVEACHATCRRAMHQNVLSAAKFGTISLRRLLKLPIMLAARAEHIKEQANIMLRELTQHLVRKSLRLVCGSIVDLVLEKLQCVPQLSQSIDAEYAIVKLAPRDMLIELLKNSYCIEQSLNSLRQAFEEQQQLRRAVREAYLARKGNHDL